MSGIYRPPVAGGGDELLVFGGRGFVVDQGISGLDDVWALRLSGPGTGWERRLPNGAPPHRRFSHTSVYDPGRDRMIVYGGRDPLDAVSPYFSDVWALESGGSAWTSIVPSGTAPQGRTNHAAAFDPSGDRMFVFAGRAGGPTGSTLKNDVWQLAFAGGTPTWTEILPAGAAPSVREHSSVVFDPVGPRLIVFGGVGATSNLRTNDVWALDLSGAPTWSQLTPSGTPPTARSRALAIVDPLRRRMVVHGGLTNTGQNDVWALSLDTPYLWTQLQPSAPIPPTRNTGVAAYDSQRDGLLVAAGGSGNDELMINTWFLQWGDAVAVTPASPASGIAFSSGYPNPARGHVTFAMSTPRAVRATVRIYDLAGRRVRTAFEGVTIGTRSVGWALDDEHGVGVAAGVYLAVLDVAGAKQTRRVVVLE